MTRNADFAALLRDERRLVTDTARADARDRGLEAIVAQDPTKPGSVRQAILSHQGYFVNHVVDTGGTNADRYQDDAGFIDDTNSAALCQFAARQRVTCGLTRLKEAELTAFVKEADAQKCREQLAATPEMSFLQKAPNWKANSAGTLDDAKVRYLQIQALQLMVYKKLQTASAKEIADFENNYAANPVAGLPGNKIIVASALVIPASFLTNQGVNPTSINDIIVERKKEFAKTAFIEIVDKLTPQQASTAAMFNKLAQDTAGFKNDTTEGLDISNVDDADIPDLQGKLGIKYIESAIANMSNTQISSLSSSTNMAAGLKSIYTGTNNNFVDEALRQPNATTIIKQALLERQSQLKRDAVVTQLKNSNKDLKGLMPAPGTTMSLNLFKTQLINLGIKDVDWIQQTDMEKMHTDIHDIVLERAFEKEAPLGQHSALEKMYQVLTPERQAYVRQNLSIIASTTNPEVLLHYFGENPKKGFPGYSSKRESIKGPAEVTVDAVINENVQNNLFKSIHNSEVAKLLANWSPKITLTPANIDTINDAFVNSGTAIDLTDATEWEDFKAVVAAQTGITRGDINNAFDSNQTDIANQQAGNTRELQANAKTKSPLENKIYTLALSINKTKALTGELTIPTLTDGISAFDNVNSFVVKVGEKLTDDEKKVLKGALTNEMLREMRTDFVTEGLNPAASNPATPSTPSMRTNIQTQMSRFKKEREVLTMPQKWYSISKSPAQNILAFKSFNEHHARSITFLDQIKKDPLAMQTKYKNLRDHCLVIIHRLNLDKSNLNSYRDALRGTGVKENERLAESIDAEIVLIDKELTSYNAALKGIEFAKAVTDEGFKTKDSLIVGEKWDLSKAASPDNLPNTKAISSTVSGATHANKEIERVVVDQLNVGETRTFILPDPTANTKQELKGEFIQTRKENGVDSFDVINFPKGQKGDPQAENAKVQFAMGYARQILAARGSNPSKDDPIPIDYPLDCSNDEHTKDAITYIWTAFMVLGEKSKDKFGPDAIEMNVIGCDPKSDQKWGLGNGIYKSDSVYSRVFNSDKAGGQKKVVDKIIGQVTKLEQHSAQAMEHNKTADQIDVQMYNKAHDTKIWGVNVPGMGRDEKHEEITKETKESFRATGPGYH
ncbi:MAG: hypothetical protein WC627_02865 [Legionella sp.]|jgi:hypothetical protein